MPLEASWLDYLLISFCPFSYVLKWRKAVGLSLGYSYKVIFCQTVGKCFLSEQDVCWKLDVDQWIWSVVDHSLLSLIFIRCYFCKQWKAQQAEKHQFRDILRSEKTGIPNYSVFGNRQKMHFFFLCTSFLASHISVRWRFKSKSKVETASTSSLDIYLNHQMGSHTSNEHSSKAMLSILLN